MLPLLIFLFVCMGDSRESRAQDVVWEKDLYRAEGAKGAVALRNGEVLVTRTGPAADGDHVEVDRAPGVSVGGQIGEVAAQVMRAGFVQTQLAELPSPAARVGFLFLDRCETLGGSVQLFGVNRRDGVGQSGSQPERPEPVVVALDQQPAVVSFGRVESGASSGTQRETLRPRSSATARACAHGACRNRTPCGKSLEKVCVACVGLHGHSPCQIPYLCQAGIWNVTARIWQLIMPVWRNGRRTGLKIPGP